MAEHIFFNGRKYSKSSHGYWRSTDREHKLLHVAVWEFHNGEIPKGCHIHHVDGNKNNNAIENLQCLPHSEHVRLHRLQEVTTFSGVCACCGKEFKSKRPARFCSKECRRQTQFTHYYEERICGFCGKVFKVRRDSKTQFCSPNCASVGSGITKLTDKQKAYICEVYKPRDPEFGGAALARKFNVSGMTISRVVSGQE